MNTQQEIITWHKYPDEKPEFSGYYLACIGGVHAVYSEYDGRGWRNPQSCWAGHFTVFAWAYMPTGWKEEK